MSREITSVSKTTQKFFDSAAAVFVITQEDIRRSGVTSIAEALRLAPGMSVAQVDASKWAISARGFNSRFANKMLVLIDGRPVYTPIFSGTFWEAINLVLEDIERLEVIRGPGASLWGTNAVNGVINIITKPAQATQGGLVSLTAGNEDRGIVELRYGAEYAEQLFFRAYGKYANRDGLVDINDADAGDDWQLKRGGFRADWHLSANDTVMLQGDIYDGDTDQNFIVPSGASPTGGERVLNDGNFAGGWLMSRWEQAQSLSSRTALQTYYQKEKRHDLLANYQLDTFGAEFQHELALFKHHELIWGLDYRFHTDKFMDAPLLVVSPKDRDYSLFSLFLQDRIALFDERVELTLGSKFEHNSFTGW
ncbi:MAG: TonB-dependent receptor plug domain-containing protein, partial [Gammaproteobacteria bacterium]